MSLGTCSKARCAIPAHSLWKRADQCPSSFPTFSNPLSTGMRKRTSGSRLWYRSRTRFTSSGDGGTLGKTEKSLEVIGMGQG